MLRIDGVFHDSLLYGIGVVDSGCLHDGELKFQSFNLLVRLLKHPNIAAGLLRQKFKVIDLAINGECGHQYPVPLVDISISITESDVS